MNQEPYCAAAHALARHRAGKHPTYLRAIRVQKFSDRREQDLQELRQCLGSLEYLKAHHLKPISCEDQENPS